MSAHSALSPTVEMARVLGVLEAGFLVWRRRPCSAYAIADKVLLQQIRANHGSFRQNCVALHVLAWLRAGGENHVHEWTARLTRPGWLVRARAAERLPPLVAIWTPDRQRTGSTETLLPRPAELPCLPK